ncbi:MAG: hypothetical protein ACXVAP_00185 [Candidatus Limnocylindrales bacterium]
MTEPIQPEGPVWSAPPGDAPPAPVVPGPQQSAPPPQAAPISAPTPMPLAAGAVTVRPKSRSSGLVSVLLAGAVVVAAAGVAFAVGRVTAPTTAAAGGRGAFGANGQFPNASGATGGNFRGGAGAALGAGGVALKGTVTAVNGQTITLQLSGGQTVTINLSGTTTYHTATTGSASDVTNGSTVVVQVQGDLGGGRNFNGASPNPSGGAGTLQFTASDVTVVRQ